MWDDFIDWRVKHKIDECRVTFTLTQNFKFPALPELRKMYPHGYHKVDKQVCFEIKVLVPPNLY